MSIVSYLDLALALPAALALAAPDPVRQASDDDLRLTITEAVALLPSSMMVHVQIEHIRARWERADLIAAIKAGRGHRLTLAARAAGFGLFFTRETGEPVLVQTEDAKVRAWLERQAKRAGE